MSDENLCPKCKRPVKPGSRFCGECGTQLAGTCPSCGQEMENGAPVCTECGYDVRTRQGGDDSTGVPDSVRNIYASREGRINAMREQRKKRKWPVVLLLLIIIGAAGAGGYYYYANNAVPEEPDWKARYSHWKGVYAEEFVPPVLDTAIDVELDSGRVVSGVLKEINSDSIVLQSDSKELGINRNLLGKRSRYALFRDYYAEVKAKREVRKEHDAWLQEQERRKNQDPLSAAKEILGLAEPVIEPPVQESAVSSSQQGRKSSRSSRRITCPECDGLGYFMESGPGKKYRTRVACRICDGKGYRDIVFPKGATVCPECSGMGRIYDDSAELAQMSRESDRLEIKKVMSCPMCMGQGYVINKAEVDPR